MEILAVATASAFGCNEGPTQSAFDAGVDAAWTTDAESAPDAAIPPSRPASRPLTQYVDSMRGTGGIGYNDIGSVHPGPQWPFGMVRPGPNTVTATGGAFPFLHCSGYAATDTHVAAIGHTRLHGVGIVDEGVVAFMPTLDFGPATASTAGLRSRQDKTRERATPKMYSMVLDDPRFGGREIGVASTASARAAVHRIVFPEGSPDVPTDAAVVVDLGHALPSVRVDDANVRIVPSARELEGSAHFSGGYSSRFGGVTVHFVMRFSRDFSSFGTWAPPASSASGAEGTLFDGVVSRDGATGGAFVRFALEDADDVRVAVGLSYVDVEHARTNLDTEAGDLDFDRVAEALENEWERRLGRVEIEARDDREFRLFYTALYHSMFMPTLATDTDGSYRGIDGEVRVADGFTYYTDFSLWDTYRTMHPLMSLIEPATQRDFVRSLVAMGEARGTFPRWPLGTGETGGMLGDPAVIVLADSLARGVDDFDVDAAYRIGRASADADVPGARGAMESYLRLGYASVESGSWSVSKTLEFAYADDALATIAESVGDDEGEARYRARGKNYRNVYDTNEGFFVGRYEDGGFAELSPFDWEDYYSEGNAWQYQWLVPHDPEGLAELLGGRASALGKLGRFFDESSRERRLIAQPRWYWHGNEPDLHAPFLFAAWGDADGAATWSSWARAEHYDLGPTGLPGNDDSGTLSAWYVFAALGLYPVAGTDLYWFGSPSVTRALLHLDGGDLVIEAPEASVARPLVSRIELDGVSLEDRTRIRHAALTGTSTLRFFMR
jgi:predicted alpha-1,2-mannosidase